MIGAVEFVDLNSREIDCSILIPASALGVFQMRELAALRIRYELQKKNPRSPTSCDLLSIRRVMHTRSYRRGELELHG
jgi:hypothetical protein